MSRNCLARAAVLAAAAATTVGLLAGCSGNDSTASSAPSSVTSAPAATAPSATNLGTRAPTTSPGPAATAPPEEPQPMPNDFPGPDAPTQGAREQAYLAELETHGITSSGNGDSAVTIANYYCAAVRDGVPADEITTFVNAMAGSEQAVTGGNMSEADAGAIYIDVAKTTYCP
ncbi:MAG TPA: DUF732 domain-containing protein [Aldersonia sp.]